jgi:excisionase family DNA binding protein
VQSVHHHGGMTSALLTTGEAAKLASVSRWTIRRWCQDGKLSCVVTPTGQYLVHRAPLIEALELEDQS